MAKAQATAATTDRSGPTKADQGLTPNRQKVLTYVIKRKAVDGRSGIPRADIYANAGGPAIVAAMIETGHLAVAKTEEGEVVHVTKSGKLAHGKLPK